MESRDQLAFDGHPRQQSKPRAIENLAPNEQTLSDLTAPQVPQCPKPDSADEFWSSKVTRVEPISSIEPPPGLAGIFMKDGKPNHAALLWASRIVACYCSGDTLWTENRIGNAVTLGNPLIAHRLWGHLASLERPAAIANRLRDLFVETVGISSEDLNGRSPTDFPSLQKLFTRDIDPSLRPIHTAEMVMPVDGYCKGFGQIGPGGIIPQHVKGHHFTAADFIHDHAKASTFGHWVNLYLSPRDYHHIHAPVSGHITGMRYIPGTLWQVNQWSHTHTPGLYPKQERIIIDIQSPEFGAVALVMVGATMVGGMRVTFDPGFHPRTAFWDRRADTVRKYGQPIAIEKGARLGSFLLGSTVVLLTEPNVCSFAPRPIALDREVLRVQFGEPLARSVRQIQKTAVSAPSATSYDIGGAEV